VVAKSKEGIGKQKQSRQNYIKPVHNYENIIYLAAPKQSMQTNK